MLSGRVRTAGQASGWGKPATSSSATQTLRRAAVVASKANPTSGFANEPWNEWRVGSRTWVASPCILESDKRAHCRTSPECQSGRVRNGKRKHNESLNAQNLTGHGKWLTRVMLRLHILHLLNLDPEGSGNGVLGPGRKKGSCKEAHMGCAIGSWSGRKQQDTREPFRFDPRASNSLQAFNLSTQTQVGAVW